MAREASALDALQSGTDCDVLCKSLGRLGANALVMQIPRFDLVALVLAESLEERSPALVAKLVDAQTVSGRARCKCSAGAEHFRGSAGQ